MIQLAIKILDFCVPEISPNVRNQQEESLYYVCEREGG